MSDLQNQAPANTYKGLLQVGDYTNGVDSTSKYVSDGEGTSSALSLSTTKVGIGTNSPSQELEVNGNVVADEYALDGTGSSSSAVAIHAPTTNELAIRTNSTERMRIDSNGNCGIGTTNPGAKLEISGGGANVWLKTNNITNRQSNTLAGQNYLNLTDQLPTDENSFEIGPGYINLNRDDDVPINQLSFGMNGTLGAAIEVGSDTPDTPPNQHSLRFKVGRDNTDNKAGIERMRIDDSGNLGIGTGVWGTDAEGVLGIKNGTAPTSSPADMVQLYAEDVTASSELRVRDEAGNVTTLSPHAKDAPNTLYDNGKGVDEMHRVANHYLGTIVFTNVDRRNALMQKQLNGEELPEDRTFTVTETFAEYNARTGADLQVEDWDANQQAMFDAQEEKVVARQAEIDTWDNEEEPPEPLESYVKKPKPDWLS